MCYYKLFRRHGGFLCAERQERSAAREGEGESAGGGGSGSYLKMRAADFYTAHNRLMRVMGTLGQSRFPKLR